MTLLVALILEASSSSVNVYVYLENDLALDVPPGGTDYSNTGWPLPPPRVCHPRRGGQHAASPSTDNFDPGSLRAASQGDGQHGLWHHAAIMGRTDVRFAQW